MDYREMVKRVSRLDFIRNEQKADAAVKAILGILASRLNEEDSRKMTEFFPGHLKLESLNGDLQTPGQVSVADYTRQICAQFKLSVHQARILVRNVLYYAKEAAGSSFFTEIGKSLSNDWAEAIQKA